MKIIHQNCYTKDELALYRLTIYKNVLDCAKALIGAMQQFKIEPRDPRNNDNAFARGREEETCFGKTDCR